MIRDAAMAAMDPDALRAVLDAWGAARRRSPIEFAAAAARVRTLLREEPAMFGGASEDEVEAELSLATGCLEGGGG